MTEVTERSDFIRFMPDVFKQFKGVLVDLVAGLVEEGIVFSHPRELGDIIPCKIAFVQFSEVADGWVSPLFHLMLMH